MSLTELALSQVLKMALTHADRVGVIVKAAEAIDAEFDKNLGKSSENVQEQLVRRVLLPLARELMHEDRTRFVNVLEAEQMGFNGYAERSLKRGDIGRVGEGDDRGEPGARQNFGPAN